MNKFKYHVFGLTIESELELPELVANEAAHPEVFIRYGNVPDSLDNVISKGGLYEISPEGFLFKVPSAGSFYVINGKQIIVKPNLDAEPETIRMFLLGSVMGALLHQRGDLPIHGSTVQIDNEALMIIGKSGAGKSSLAAGFEQKGLSIIADDISVVKRINEKNFVCPGVPHLKLWKDVLQHIGISSNLPKVRIPLEKYKKPNLVQPTTSLVEVRKVLLLSTKNTPGFKLDRLSGVEKFKALKSQIFRVKFLDGIGNPQTQFTQISELANSIELYSLVRPISPLQINELINFIHTQVIKQSK